MFTRGYTLGPCSNELNTLTSRQDKAPTLHRTTQVEVGSKSACSYGSKTYYIYIHICTHIVQYYIHIFIRLFPNRIIGFEPVESKKSSASVPVSTCHAACFAQGLEAGHFHIWPRIQARQTLVFLLDGI